MLIIVLSRDAFYLRQGYKELTENIGFPEALDFTSRNAISVLIIVLLLNGISNEIKIQGFDQKTTYRKLWM